MGLVTAIANQKGGVGKTTTSVNMAASLALQGRRTLLVDLDSQGSASSGVGAAVSDGPSVYDVLIGASPAAQALRHTDLAELDIIPATPDLAGAEVELVSLSDREARLRTQLSPLVELYEHVVIDCPPSLGMLTLNALCCAQSLLIPLQCEFYALEGLRGLLNTVERIRVAYNPGLFLEGVVLTMSDTRTSLSQQIEAEVRTHFGRTVFETVVPRNVRIAESPSHGLPVLLYDPVSKGSRAYTEVTKEFLDRLAERLRTESSDVLFEEMEVGEETTVR